MGGANVQCARLDCEDACKDGVDETEEHLFVSVPSTKVLDHELPSGMGSQKADRKNVEEQLGKLLVLWESGESVEEEILCIQDLDAISEMRATLYDASWFALAERLGQEHLQLATQVLGENHPDTLESVGWLAALFRQQGKMEEAEQLRRRHLDYCKKAFGVDHLDTLKSANNLALLLSQQHRLEEAEPLYHHVLEGRDKALGRDHPDTLRSVTNLAVFFVQRGKPEEAEPLCRWALESREKTLGQDHPSTLDAAGGLAAVLEAKGDMEAATELRHRWRLEGQEGSWTPLGASSPAHEPV